MGRNARRNDYLRHFGLERSLAEASSGHDGDTFLGDKQRRLVEQLSIALSTPDSIIVLTGQAGVGKSTLAVRSAMTITEDPVLVWIGTSVETTQELVQLLLLEFGLATRDVGRVEGAELWRRAVRQYGSKGKRTVVLVEVASDLDTRVLRNLNSLTAASPRGHPGANVVLMGSSELDSTLGHDDLESMRQRIRLRGRLDPMSAQETQDYFRFLALRAGREPGEIFGPGSLAVLHVYAGGIPRVAQNLCESALNVASARGESKVSAKTIRDVAVGMLGLNKLAGETSMRGPSEESAGEVSDRDVPSRGRTATEQALGIHNNDVPTLSDIVDPNIHVLEGASASVEQFSEPEETRILSTRQKRLLGSASDDPTVIYDEDSYQEAIEEALRALGN